jgi:hypothetical protein
LHCPLATQPRPARSSSGPLIDRHWSRHSALDVDVERVLRQLIGNSATNKLPHSLATRFWQPCLEWLWAAQPEVRKRVPPALLHFAKYTGMAKQAFEALIDQAKANVKWNMTE